MTCVSSAAAEYSLWPRGPSTGEDGRPIAGRSPSSKMAFKTTNRSLVGSSEYRIKVVEYFLFFLFQNTVQIRREEK